MLTPFAIALFLRIGLPSPVSATALLQPFVIQKIVHQETGQIRGWTNSGTPYLILEIPIFLLSYLWAGFLFMKYSSQYIFKPG